MGGPPPIRAGLPLATNPEAERAERSTSAPTPPHRIEPPDGGAQGRAVVSELLVGEGYHVRAAANGRDALAVLATWRPAVILLDLMMPEMDVWAFLARQQLDLELVRIPVIVMSTTYGPHSGAGRVAAADLVIKPDGVGALPRSQ